MLQAALARAGRHEAAIDWWDNELQEGVARIFVRDGVSRLVADHEQVGAVWNGEEEGDVFVYVTQESLMPSDGSRTTPGVVWSGMVVSLYLTEFEQRRVVRVPAEAGGYRDIECLEASSIMRANGAVLSAVAPGKDFGVNQYLPL
eukprot:COSAG05_NODE_8115_length_735_cov_0.948113_2_plen_144_part_01